MKVDYVMFTNCADEFKLPMVFPPQHPTNVLGEVISKKGLAQFRLAETEKYAHVTYFTNGGVETPFPLEDRQVIPSPKVKTYDLKPEMSAFEVGDTLIEKLRSEKYSFIMVNFANCDMVGHTGIMEAAMKAVSTVNNVLSKAIPVAYELGYDCFITADHGNAEQMINLKTGEPFTEHTTNVVPFCVVSKKNLELKGSGKLCDIAPTILDLMGIEKPAEMTGCSLIQKK